MITTAPLASAAEQIPSLHGSLTARAVTLEDPFSIAVDQAAFALDRQDNATPLRLSSEGTAGRIVVNWTRYEYAAVGQSPDDPNASLVSLSTGPPSHGEAIYDAASLAFVTREESANALIHPRGELRAVLVPEVTTTLGILPSHGEDWSAGRPDEVQQGQASNSSRFWATHHVEEGAPRAELVGPGALNLSGAQEIDLWGVHLVVTDRDGGTHEFQSGAWWEDATDTPLDDLEAVRQKVEQILRLRIDAGDVQIAFEEGSMWLTGAEVSAQRAREAMFEEATGILESVEKVARPQNESIRIIGSLDVGVRGSTDPHLLQSDLAATDAIVDAGPVDPGPPGGPDPSTAVPPEAVIKGTALPRSVAALFAAIGLAGLAVWATFRLRRFPKSREDWLTVAEAALVDRKGRTARRLAEHLIRRNRQDADAWFILGTSLLQDERPKVLVQRVAPVMDSLPPTQRPGLAFLLALANARMGLWDAAIPWLRSASSDPVLRERVRNEPSFRALASQPNLRLLFDEGGAGYG